MTCYASIHCPFFIFRILCAVLSASSLCRVAEKPETDPPKGYCRTYVTRSTMGTPKLRTEVEQNKPKSFENSLVPHVALFL